MRLLGIFAASSSALAIAPFIPFGPSVRTNRAPRTLSSLRRSIVIVSGIVRMSFKPFAAATNASAIPVFPEVGSIKTVFDVIFPLLIASSIIEKPMRSFTLERGLKNSSFNKTSAWALCASAVRFRRTNGVLPIVSVMSLYILAMIDRGIFEKAVSGKPEREGKNRRVFAQKSIATRTI